MSFETEKIKVLVVKPKEKPYAEEIDCNLETFQEIVGGNIQDVFIEDEAVLVCHEEGKLLGLTPNRVIGDDVICGTFFIAGYDGGEELTSLSDEKIEKYTAEFKEGISYYEDTSDNKNKNFIHNLNMFLDSKDFDIYKLSESYDTEDMQYAKDVLREMHNIFVQSYGTDCIDEIDDSNIDFLYAPAVIRSIDTGKTCIGLVYLDRTSSGEHWDTVYMTKFGIISQSCTGYNETVKNEMKSYMPYTYWYTPEYDSDIHVDKQKTPKEVKEMIDYAVKEEHTQSMEMG